MSEHPPAAGHGHDAHAAPAHGATGSSIGGKILHGTKKVLEAPFRGIGWGLNKVKEGAMGSVGFLRRKTHAAAMVAAGIAFFPWNVTKEVGKELGLPMANGPIETITNIAGGALDLTGKGLALPFKATGTALKDSGHTVQTGINELLGIGGGNGGDHGHGGHDSHASHDAGHGDAHGGHDAGHDAGHGGHGHA
ncbi:hypothetical protein KBD59_00725 [Candidatus Gracilibacteria bacterium]|nr:hypothetical protein [Candidatus Gracilibacteria bacterium]